MSLSGLRCSELLAAYEQKVLVEGFLPDKCQTECLDYLDRLQAILLENSDGQPPRGLYMFGGVGTGKTMMLDLFHQEVTKAGIRCQIPKAAPTG